MIRLVFAMLTGRVAGRLSRLFGRGGSAIPGLVAERIDPRLIEKLVAAIPGGVVVVTGTNGKTTTTKMLTCILDDAGRTVITNPTGSNLVRGVATRLIEVADMRGRVSADLALFEVDEAALRVLGPRLMPRLVVVTNLARDQLDRFGELITTAEHIRSALRHAASVVLNADDDMVTALDEGLTIPVVRFGAAEHIRRLMPSDASLYDSSEPPAPVHAADVVLGEAEPDGDGIRIRVDLDGKDPIEARLQVPGVYNGYNAAAAVAAATVLEVDGGSIARSLESMPPAFGRGQVVEYRGRRVKLLLVKNPAGFNQAIALLGSTEGTVPVMVAINDNHADGRDVSWLWDARVEDLASTDLVFGASGTRAHDMAVRFKYAGIDAWAEPDLNVALERTVAAAPPGGEVVIVPTYTAMLDLLALLMPDTTRREAWT